MHEIRGTRRLPGFTLWRAALMAAGLSGGLAGSAHAFRFNTGNTDLNIFWDNTVRLNVSYQS